MTNRKRLLILSVLLALFLTACGDDDQPDFVGGSEGSYSYVFDEVTASNGDRYLCINNVSLGDMWCESVSRR